MSEFTRAIFAAKELFGPEEMKQFSLLGGARERQKFVDKVVPEELTRISVVTELEELEELEEELEEEEEEEVQEELVIQKGARLFSPHPRFPCLSDAVRVNYSSERGRHVSAARWGTFLFFFFIFIPQQILVSDAIIPPKIEVSPLFAHFPM